MFNRMLSNRLTVVNLVALLLIGAVAGRMLPFYVGTSKAGAMIGLMAAYLLLFATRGLVTRWLGSQYFHLYATLQMGLTLIMMTAIFLDDAPLDFFALLLVPVCMQAMWYLPENQGMIWVGLLWFITAGLLTSYFVVYEHSWEGVGYSLGYVSIFVLVAIFSSVTRRADEARNRTQMLLQELQAANAKLEEYSMQVEQLAIVEERSRLARELHDSVSQTIFSLTLTAQAARLLLDRDPSRVPQELDRLQTLSRNALAEMRTLIQQNKPVGNEELDLAEMLRKHAEERQTMDGLTVHVEIIGDHSLSQVMKSGLFRIAQEAINNIIKHAKVKEAWLTLDLSGNPLRLCVQDHGAGFDTANNSRNPGHLGLEGMQERVKSLGGKIKITSAPGEGTLVDVQVPLPEEEIHG
jgi:signal transduction histidine kinase